MKRNIRRILNAGTLPDNIDNTWSLLSAAAAKLDADNAADITGVVVFQDTAGKFFVGTTEFIIRPAAPAFVAQTITDEEVCECDNCGHLEKHAAISKVCNMESRVDAGSIVPAGQCEKCGALSYLITKQRAAEIAGVVPKKLRRKGLK